MTTLTAITIQMSEETGVGVGVGEGGVGVGGQEGVGMAGPE